MTYFCQFEIKSSNCFQLPLYYSLKINVVEARLIITFVLLAFSKRAYEDWHLLVVKRGLFVMAAWD